MIIRQTARTTASASLARTPHRWRHGLARLALVGSLWLGAICLASAANAPMATLSPLHPDAGTLIVDPGKDLSLEVVKQVDGHGVDGQQVDWTVSGPGTADLAPATSTTAAKTATNDAGMASTVFHASTAGDYVVTARTQKNPGCAAPGCATWVSTRFAVNVGGGGAAGGESGVTRNEVIGAVVAIGTGVAVLAASNRGSNHDDQATLNRTLAKVAGDNQSAAANSPLAQPLAVIAKNNGVPAASIGVQWSASGGAALSSPLSFTDATGVAGVHVVSVGPGPGPVTVTARRSDNSAAIATFTVNVLQPSLNIVSGDNQTGIPGQGVPQPLVVQALLGSQPQAGVPISWVATGGATIVNVSNGGVTGSSGRNQAIVRFGPTAGPVQVTATRTDDGLSQTFFLNSATTNTLTVVSGDGQTACPTHPLPQALEVNATTNNKPAVDVTINWIASGGATVNPTSSLTGGGGNARTRVTNVGATYSAFPTTIGVFASRQDDPSATASFTATIPASTLQPSSGDGQSGPIGTPGAAPIVIQLNDGCGNPIHNQPIAWQVISGSAQLSSTNTTTAPNGQSQITFTYSTTPGPVTIQATALGGGASVFFTENATTSGFSITAGNNQTRNPGQTLPLSVSVTPAIAGVPVTFTVLGGSGSTVSPQSTVTNGSGIATTTLTFGTTPVPFTVVAQTGTSSVTFNERVAGSLVTPNLTIVSGDSQVIAPNAPSQPLVVLLADNGSPIVHETVNWSASSGTLSATSTMTGTDGQAQVTITPSGNGPITVTANFPTHNQYIGSSVSFSENTTLGTIASSNANDQSVGQALDAACAELQGLPSRTPQQQDMLNQCLLLAQSSSVSSEATAVAINQLTPAVAETQTSTATTATTTQFNNLAGRMQAVRGGAHGMSFAGLAFDNENGSLSMSDIGSAVLGADDAKKKDVDTFSRWGFFGSGQIDRQSGSTQNATPGYDFASNGVTFGVDYRANDGLVVGGAMGFTHQSTDLVGGQGSLSMHGWSLSGYASWYRKSDWYVDSSLTWGNNNYDAQRRIAYTLPLPNGTVAIVDQVAKSSSGGNSVAGSMTFGRDFHSKALAYGFYGKLQYDHEAFDAFTEQLNQSLAGSGLGLSVASRTTTSVASVLGAKWDYNKSMKWGVMVPHAEIEWQHEFRTDPNQFTAFFIDDPTHTPILIHGDASDANFFKLGAGMSFVFPQGRSAFLLYDRTVGRQGISEYNVSLGFRMEF